MQVCSHCHSVGTTTPSAVQAGAGLVAAGLVAGAALYAMPFALFVPAALAVAGLSPTACARCKSTALVPSESPVAQRIMQGAR